MMSSIIPKIAIDGVIFQASQFGGVSRVWRSLLTAWAKTDFAPNLLILSRSGTTPEIPCLTYRIIPPYDYADTEGDRLMLQQVCDEEHVDIFISTYYTTPISATSICLVYDMIPEVFQVDLTQPVWREKHRAIRQASAHAAISQNTANDLAKFFPQIQVEAIAVAHCGVESTFSPATSQEINCFRDRHQICKPYYLLVGDNRSYKRYRLFFEAFSQLSNRQDFDIAWVGNGLLLPPEFLELTTGSTIHSLKLDDGELAIVYSGAIALIFPSLYEGFGLPLLEAMACGCPVITCHNSSIPEVVSDSAFYIEDGNPQTFITALVEVQDTHTRTHFTTKGIDLSKQFSWENMANKLQSSFLEFSQENVSKLVTEQNSPKGETYNSKACKVCGAITHLFAEDTILNKYKVQYFQCSQCGFVQTEDPYWLTEAYSSAIAPSDVGLVSRNINLSHITNNLIFEYFDYNGQFIDYGGGYGLFVRLMRDLGYNFFWHDKFCTNIFAQGFEIDVTTSCDRFTVLTCFEVFEHLVDPIAEIERMLALSKNVFFGTQLLPENNPKPHEWWYYALHEGQHIVIFTKKSLEIIAKRFNLNFYSNGSTLHLFTEKELPESLFDNSSLYTIYPTRFPSLVPTDFAKIVSQSQNQGFTQFREINLIVFPNWQAGLDSVGEALQPAIAALLRHPQRGAIALLIDVCDVEAEVSDAFLADFLLETIMNEDFDLDEEPQISLIHDLTEVQWKAIKAKLKGRITLKPENFVRIQKLIDCDLELIPLPSLLGKIFEAAEL